jgi:uncharacterized membrane protein
MEANMSDILVITFEDQVQAPQVLQTLKKLENQEMLNLEDAAVIVKNAEGKIEVKNMTEGNVKKGAAVGGVLGLIVGSLLFPLAGIALGAAGGALIGKSLGDGVDKKFVQDVQDSLIPGGSAILFIVKNENIGLLITALRPYSGKLYQSTFDSDVEGELRKALL